MACVKAQGLIVDNPSIMKVYRTRGRQPYLPLIVGCVISLIVADDVDRGLVE
jgi:hypothetical protein